MGKYFEAYLNMTKEASDEGLEKLSEEQEAVIDYYVDGAETLLKQASAEQVIEDYDEEDIANLALMLMNNEVEEEETQEKIANAADLGAIAGIKMAETFVEYINSINE